MSLFSAIANLFYPPTCPACGVLMKRDGDWCPSCLARVWHPRRINRSQQLKAIDACYCLADYDGAMRQLLHAIKYGGKQGKCRACRVFLERFPWPERLNAIDMVVPVPLAPEKLKAAASIKSKAFLKNGPTIIIAGPTSSRGCVRQKPSGTCPEASGRKTSIALSDSAKQLMSEASISYSSSKDA